MTTTVQALDQLIVVNLDIHIWTARKKLVPLDLGGAELPPEDLASLGSKRICNPEDLRTFGTLKARAVNLLERNGIRFLNGWAVLETRMVKSASNSLPSVTSSMQPRSPFSNATTNPYRIGLPCTRSGEASFQAQQSERSTCARA